MEYILKTERLALREVTFDDAEFIIELLNSPGWLRFIGERNIRNRQDAEGYITNAIHKSYNEHGFGLYLVELKEDKTAIGLCGLLKRDFLDYPDIGYAYLPQFWGKGYAFEAALAMRDYAFETVKAAQLMGITSVDNEVSQKVLLKLGLKYVETMQFPAYSDLSMVFCT